MDCFFFSFSSAVFGVLEKMHAMQEAETIFDKIPDTDHVADFAWNTVYTAASEMMWELTGEPRCVFGDPKLFSLVFRSNNPTFTKRCFFKKKKNRAPILDMKYCQIYVA